MKTLCCCFFLISTFIYCNSQSVIEECMAEMTVDKVLEMDGNPSKPLKNAYLLYFYYLYLDDPNPVIYAQDPKLKCINACIARKQGLIVDGTMDVEKQYDLLKRYYSGSLVYLKDAISACASIANEQKDDCTAVNVMRQCLTEKLKRSSSS